MQRKKVAVETACGQHVNSATSPEDLHKLFVQALNSGDLDGLVGLYAFDGFLMARSGPARGIGAIRKALAEYVAMKPTLFIEDFTMAEHTPVEIVRHASTLSIVGRAQGSGCGGLAA